MKYANYYLSNIILIFLLTSCINLNLNDDNTTNYKDKIDKTIYYPTEVSYDEYGNKTAGLIGLTEDKSRYIITKKFKDRYNTIVNKYKDFTNLYKDKDTIKPYYKNNKYYTIEKYALYEFIRLNIIDNNPNLIVK